MYYSWYIHLKCSICQRSGGVIVEGFEGDEKIVGCTKCGLSSTFKLQEDLKVFEAGLEIEIGVYELVWHDFCC